MGGQLNAADKDADVHARALFVAGPGDPIPWTWEPAPEHRILKVLLSWKDLEEYDRPDVAYLRMPENPKDVILTEEYAPAMAHVCRVLAAGRIPGRPGYPAVPDAWFTVQGLGRGVEQVGSYGGLAFLPQLWDGIVKQWEKDPAAPLILEARTAAGLDGKEVSDRWHIFLPGADCPYDKQYIPHYEAENAPGLQKRIMALLKSTMDGKSFAALQCVEFHLPGGGMFIPTSKAGRRRGLVVSTTGKDLNTAFQPLADLLAKWKKKLVALPGVRPATDGLALFPQFLAIRPVFGDYTLNFTELDKEAVWDPSSTTLEQFRKIVAELTTGDDVQRYSPATSWIALLQGLPKYPGSISRGQDHMANKPRLLVGPMTTESDWELVCQMIVEPFLSLVLLDDSNVPRKSDRRSHDRHRLMLTNSRFWGRLRAALWLPRYLRDIRLAALRQ